jgi:hypothetical protein
MSRRTLALAGAIAVGLTASFAAQDLTRDDALRMEGKLNAILARGARPVTRAAPLRTSFSEREVNAYFKFNSHTFPTGVVNPRLGLTGPGRVEAQATVDLTAIRKSKERGWLDPMNLVGGSVVLRMAGTLKSSGGMGTLQVESATLGGIPIPKLLLQEVIAFYTKSPELPDGFDITKPFPLPVGIREVQLERGAATVVQ